MTDVDLHRRQPWDPLMADYARNLGLPRLRSDLWPRYLRGHLLVQFLLLFSLSLAHCRPIAAAGANIANTPVVSIEFGSTFAIADFDGDDHADIATIQTRRNDTSGTEYWILLNLSSSGLRSIRVPAPRGGLMIEARDVNNDHFVDLVLTTALSRRPLAILINDGWGGFSRVQASVFPDAFTDTSKHRASASEPRTRELSVPLQQRPIHYSQVARMTGVHWHADRLPRRNSVFVFMSLQLSRAERGPPSETPWV